MDIKAINTAIVTGNFTVSELDSIADAIKFKRSSLAMVLGATLRKGARVRVNHAKVQGVIGTVLKVKIKKADVDFAGKIFQVPLAMCEVV